MILPLIGIFAGLCAGVFHARSKQGTMFDMMQWAAVYAILFAIIGLFVMIGLDRSYRSL